MYTYTHMYPLLRAVLKNDLIIRQLPHLPGLIRTCLIIRSCLKFCMLGFSIMRTKNFQTYKLGLEKAEEPEI